MTTKLRPIDAIKTADVARWFNVPPASLSGLAHTQWTAKLTKQQWKEVLKWAIKHFSK